jgi:hypothetical protein
MQKIKPSLAIVFMLLLSTSFAQTATAVHHFEKVIVSPHIAVTFVEGNEESVLVEKCEVPIEKLNITVKNGTLRLYLDGAKDIEKNEVTWENGYKHTRQPYHGTIVKAVVTYKMLDNLSIRGDETQLCKSPLKGRRFRLRVYGDSHVCLNEVDLGELQAALYGESLLEVKTGSIADQKYTVYGESKINTLGINGNTSKITAYGEADFRINVSDEIKITAFGEASLAYTGHPRINKWLHFGEMKVSKLD